MRALPGDFLVAALAYLGTMVDNYFAFAAQLVVTPPARHRRVAWAQVLGVGALVAIAAAVGSALSAVPLRVVGVLAVAPFALAVHAWRQRREPVREQYRRGATTTFLATLALGGDNVAVWIPLLRATGVDGALAMLATFAVLEFAFVTSAQTLATRPGVVAWGTRHAPRLVPIVYGALGVLILFECHTL
ncbi:MAG: cadmium resistance transporter [Acidobacteriota bacterium]|nr:cadmium resistance transporter [Acidobacteriota bacterium]